MQDSEASTDLNEVADAVLRDLRPAALEREIAVTATLGDAMPPVAINGAILYQVLQNLVSNAIKFSSRGGPVSVRAFIGADGRPGMEVSDRGIGIPQELIDKVTQPFWQRQGPLVRSHGGVGLGLAIVKSHMDTLEGELRFESRVDEGTTVTVLFPASRVVHQA
jgi:signal transduction histidine kinase